MDLLIGQIRCPKCQAENRANASRCRSCGYDLFSLEAIADAPKSELDQLASISKELQRHTSTIEASNNALQTIKKILVFWLILSIVVAIATLLAVLIR